MSLFSIFIGCFVGCVSGNLLFALVVFVYKKYKQRSRLRSSESGLFTYRDYLLKRLNGKV